MDENHGALYVLAAEAVFFMAFGFSPLIGELWREWRARRLTRIAPKRKDSRVR